MIDVTQSLLIIAVIVAVTVIIRFLPFIIFSKKTPKSIAYLSEVLPYAVMGMLIVYCLKDVSFVGGSHGIPELICIAIVILLHKLFHNTLLSVSVGVISYMLLIQLVFI